MDLIWQLLIFFFAVVIHEYAHGLVASLRGDRTAQYAGRLTLNPLAHIDPLGTIFLPILLLATRSPVIFGWAKPVPINYWGLKNPKRDIILVGLAGPLANICLAAALSLILKFGAGLPLFAVSLIYQAIVVNIVLAVFNLMPIPPLDGSRVAIGLLPSSAARRYAAIEPYGFIILFVLLYLRLFDYIIWPIVNLVLKSLNMPTP